MKEAGRGGHDAWHGRDEDRRATAQAEKPLVVAIGSCSKWRMH